MGRSRRGYRLHGPFEIGTLLASVEPRSEKRKLEESIERFKGVVNPSVDDDVLIAAPDVREVLVIEGESSECVRAVCFGHYVVFSN